MEYGSQRTNSIGGKQMKEIKRYQCELCETYYADKEKAVRCEKNHKAITIKHIFYQPIEMNKSGLPYKIEVSDANGKTYIFKR